MPIDAARILARCDALARHSEQPDGVTRVFLSPEQHAVSELVLRWMGEAGMDTHVDAIGNVVGRYEGERPGLACIMLGSHLDTVRDAGKYDGILGVIGAIECVADLHVRNVRLPFAVEVVGFADEEGVRFSSTLLGSRAVAGTFDAKALDQQDVNGIAMRDALLQRGFDPQRIGDAARHEGDVLAYVEFHIEQGPVLEAEGLPVGVVTAINGGNRFGIEISGMAGHAGTVPMALRRDAYAAAAECALAVERIARDLPEVVGTVGRVEVQPGAINVIPGKVRFSLDTRAPTDALRADAVQRMRAEFEAIAARRDVSLNVTPLWDARTTPCSTGLQRQIAEAIHAEGVRVHHLPSGAGHDGMAMCAIAPVGMLFLRCRHGISHNPAEAVSVEDVATGTQVLARFIERFTAPHRA